MFTLNQGKVEREHEVSLSRLELNHDSLPTSELAASDRFHAMRNIISAEQYLRFRDAIAEQLRHFPRQAGGSIGEVDDNKNRIVTAGTGEEMCIRDSYRSAYGRS